MDHIAVPASAVLKSEAVDEESHPAAQANAFDEIEQPSTGRLVVILGSLWVRASNMTSLSRDMKVYVR